MSVNTVYEVQFMTPGAKFWTTDSEPFALLGRALQVAAIIRKLHGPGTKTRVLEVTRSLVDNSLVE
jgi:hypothetical protein